MITTRYKINASVKLKAAVVADLHGEPTEALHEALEKEQPDVILIPGDLATVGEYDDRLVDPERRGKRLKTQEAGIRFLKTAMKIAPVFYSLGNHEWGIDDVYRDAVKETGAVLLENEWVKFCGLWIGGLNSAKCGVVYKDGKQITEDKKVPDTEWLKNSPDGYRLLCCHHPEYYPLIEDYADCVVAGHAHGAQWRFFGRGVFAPGQGFFPKYSKGRYGKMLVSAGLTNTTRVPRIFNPTELVIIEMTR